MIYQGRTGRTIGSYAIVSGIERAAVKNCEGPISISLGKDTLKVYTVLNAQDDDDDDEIIEKLYGVSVGQMNEVLENFKFYHHDDKIDESVFFSLAT